MNSLGSRVAITLLVLELLINGHSDLAGGQPPARPAHPNFVLILADDLGYGDLACYGSRTNSTPHIDALAERGLRFTDFHSNGPMCSATRAALLTGCYQHRFGVKFEGALGPSPDLDNGLPLEAVTVAESLRAIGYATGMFGKWHLGYNRTLWPTQQGFDEFIGLGSGDGDHHTQIDRQGQPDWWHNDQLQHEEGYTTDLITQHSIEFVRRHRTQPFLLFVSHLAIHFPWQGPDDPPQRVAGQDYADDKWGILPDTKHVAPHVRAMISALDRSVGAIQQAIEDAGIADNTLILFLSDNGGYVHYADSHFNISSNGALRGQKTEVHEGGHRVPAIAYWPGTIRPNQTVHETVLTMDLFPTFMRLADGELPTNQAIDGIDITPILLQGTATTKPRDTFWRIGDQRVARRGRWKLNLTSAATPQLYDLNRDASETTNLATEHPEIVFALSAAWTEWERRMKTGYRAP